MEALAQTVTITLPDGSTRKVPAGTTLGEIAAGIGPRLAKDALAGKIDGRLADLSARVEADARVEIVTPKSPDALALYRHSTAHLTANAVKRLFPSVQIGIGPAIENGYYYDFNPERPFTPDDLVAIEAEMRRIVAEDNKVERIEMPKDEAIRLFEGQKDALKVEIIRGIPDDRVSCYRQKDFIDLCRGPHVPSTGKLGVFKLTHTAGAYWKGDEKNPMLQRIYAACFQTQKELDEHLARIEEAKARDHRKLGKELDLFVFHPWAPASPFFLPKGAILYNGLLEMLRAEYRRRGYDEVVTPQIFDVELFRTSGHLANYRENMFFTHAEEREFGVKPMNCPGHYLLYQTRLWSYRDLPVRFADFGRLHRYELSRRHGRPDARTHVLAGRRPHLHAPREGRVRDPRVSRVSRLRRTARSASPRSRSRSGCAPRSGSAPTRSGTAARRALDAALKKAGRAYVVTPGDGAFYGPKIDFRVKDAIGRPWQLGTIQCDFAQPENFDLTYIGEDGNKHRPVVLHRAILGSLERFIGILIEHTGGNFPFWIAPVQAVVLPVSDHFAAKAREVADRLSAAGLRVEVDDRNEKLGARIRRGEMQKAPCMLVVGEKEAAAGAVAVRLRHGGDAGTMSIDDFLTAARSALAAKKQELTTEVKDR